MVFAFGMVGVVDEAVADAEEDGAVVEGGADIVDLPVWDCVDDFVCVEVEEAWAGAVAAFVPDPDLVVGQWEYFFGGVFEGVVRVIAFDEFGVSEELDGVVWFLEEQGGLSSVIVFGGDVFCGDKGAAVGESEEQVDVQEAVFSEER